MSVIVVYSFLYLVYFADVHILCMLMIGLVLQLCLATDMLASFE